MKKLLISGSSGLIGKALIEELKSDYKLEFLTTSRAWADANEHVHFWDPSKKVIETGDWSDLYGLINLSGASVAGGLWTSGRKRLIRDSRVESTNLLFQTLSKLDCNLKVYMGASAIGYYGASMGEQIFTEDSPKGKGFLADVCEEWEECHAQFNQISERLVVPRISNILSSDGGFLTPFLMSSKFGFKTYLGSKDISCSWMHIQDLVLSLKKLIEVGEGKYNMVSDHSKWHDFLKAFYTSRNTIGIPIRIPSALLPLMMGEMAHLILDGNRASNSKIKKLVSEILYQDLKVALESI